LTLLEIARRRGVFVLAALALGVAVAACGSSSTVASTGSSGSGSGSSTTSTTSGRSGFNSTAFRTCLKDHGLTLPTRRAGGANGPPAGGGGGFFGGGTPGAGGAGGFRSNPKFQAAIKACGGSFRGGFRGGGRFQISHTAITQFVTCVRQHGYPQMPNPNFSGKGSVFPASIRTNPKFVAASKSCASVLRPASSGSGAPPGGSSTASSS
jgi:hypothetical protein